MSNAKKRIGRVEIRFADVEELNLIKKAIRKKNKEDVDGVKTNVSAFMRSCAGKRARELLDIQQ